VLLATPCVAGVASPALAPEGELSLAAQLAAMEENMPAVEVFSMVYAISKAGSDYPFTTAFYESDAYKHFRKEHFVDILLPITMADTPAVEAIEKASRLRLLWDPRFIIRDAAVCV